MVMFIQKLNLRIKKWLLSRHTYLVTLAVRQMLPPLMRTDLKNALAVGTLREDMARAPLQCPCLKKRHSPSRALTH